MAGILFFEKNKIDLDLGSRVTITVTDATATDTGQTYVDYLRNRRNDSGWGTTGSNDAANTTLEVDFGELQEIDSILLIEHNLKSYTIQYWDGAAWQDFSTAINVSGNADTTKYHSFDDVETNKIKIVITGTMVTDEDKILAQLVVTQKIQQLTTQPKVSGIDVSRNRRQVKALSGRARIMRSAGAVSFSLEKDAMIDTSDLSALEALHDYYDGFLVWLCGGDSSQFRTERIGWRLKDLYLMAVSSEYSPQWHDGRFKQGTDIRMNLVEVI